MSEKELQSFLDENNIEYSTALGNYCLFYDNPNKRSYEIEYVNSVDYPIDYPKYGIKGVSKDYFYRRSREAEENGSFKMYVKDFEWANPRQREVLKSYILHAYGVTPNKFYARDCVVREVNSKEARAFEGEHCFYGKRGASLNLGLYLKKDKNGLEKDTLLMIYTFGCNFFGKKRDTIEVLRVGTVKFSHVAGGSSKLMKHFLRNYKVMKIGKSIIVVKKIKFYSDYCHNKGASMTDIGFEFIHYSGGGFMNYWPETGKIKHRQPMYHKWVMSQMKAGKCYAIPNAGTKTFIMEVENDMDGVLEERQQKTEELFL